MKLTLSILLLPLFSLAAKVGAPAPDFSLTGHDGKTYKLSDFKGKTVVLEWFNNDCPYVEKHYDSGNMQALQKQYTDKGVVWLSVVSSAKGKQGFGTPEKLTQIRAERKAASVATLIDETGQVGKAYAAKTTPHIYIIDSTGKLAYNGAIDDKPSAKESSLKGAKNYVSENLDLVIAGKPVAVAETTPYGCSVKY